MPETTSSSGLSQIWQSALPQLAKRVGHAACDSFLRNAEVLEFDGETFLLGVANEFARNWLAERHLPAISSCLSELMEKPVHVEMRVLQPEANPLEPPMTHTAPARPVAAGFGSTPLNPKYTFENFVVADCNRFAHAASDMQLWSTTLACKWCTSQQKAS